MELGTYYVWMIPYQQRTDPPITSIWRWVFGVSKIWRFVFPRIRNNISRRSDNSKMPQETLPVQTLV